MWYLSTNQRQDSVTENQLENDIFNVMGKLSPIDIVTKAMFIIAMNTYSNT